MVLAFSLSSEIKTIGSYAGFAALVAVALLVLLYFAQARETRRRHRPPSLLVALDPFGEAPRLARLGEVEQREDRQPEQRAETGVSPDRLDL